MSEFKGTKGKWSLNDTDNEIFGVSDNYNHISAGNGCYNYNGDIQSGFNLSGFISKENALLISKAPEMLEMLKEILECQDNGEVYHSYKIEQLIKEATDL